MLTLSTNCMPGYFLGPTLSGFVSDMCGGVEWGMRLIFAWSGFGFLFMVLAWTCAHWVCAGFLLLTVLFACVVMLLTGTCHWVCTYIFADGAICMCCHNVVYLNAKLLPFALFLIIYVA